MDGTIRCMFPDLGPLAAYAATATIRSASPATERREQDLWEHVLTVPSPRVVVVQDLDEPSGVGSLWGEVNGNIFRALG